MKYTKLGNSELNVSRICMGCMGFGDATRGGNSELNVSRICMGCMGFGDATRGQHSWTIDEEHSREIIKRGLDLGVNFYDTAIAYQSGTSEQYVGRALRDFANREDVVVATKFLPRTPEEIEKGVTGQQHIENMINTSLQNLGMDYVDLYIYHMWDWNTDIYDILDGLNRIVRAGKARYMQGISAFQTVLHGRSQRLMLWQKKKVLQSLFQSRDIIT